MSDTAERATSAAGTVLLTLASAQFFSRRIPTRQPASVPASEPAG